MKKRLISLVAAAALVGGIGLGSTAVKANAGTVTVKGDTQAELYGFAWTVFSWDSQIAPCFYNGRKNPDSANMPQPDYDDAAPSKKTPAYDSTYDKTYYDADSWVTRIGFTFKNEQAHLNGRLEGDFFHETNFRLRRAYVQHNFDGFYVLVGKEWILEEMFPSISASFTPPVGYNEVILRVPQVRIGTKLDLGNATLDLAIAAESGSEDAVSVMNATSNAPGDYVNLKPGVTAAQAAGTVMDVDRVTVPYLAGRAVLHLNTGFGAPAMAYVWGSVIPVYLTTQDGSTDVDDSQTSYGFGAGVRVPISMITLRGSYQYTDGAVGYIGATAYSPASYYYINGSVEDTETNTFTGGIQVTPIPCLTVGGEYDYTSFKNDDAFDYISGDDSKPTVETYVGNIEIKTTKDTILTLEWRHIEAKNFDSAGLTTDDKFTGDQVYARYLYLF